VALAGKARCAKVKNFQATETAVEAGRPHVDGRRWNTVLNFRSGVVNSFKSECPLKVIQDLK